MYPHDQIIPLSDIFLDLGFITWYKYSFIIMSGIVVAFLLGVREGKKLGIYSDVIIDGVLIIVPISIIGTRIWYIAFELERYTSGTFTENIIAMVDISQGGLAIHGGVLFAFVSAYFYTKWKGINVFATFDLIAPGFMIAQAMGRWGNFFNREAHGGVIGGSLNGDAILSLDDQRLFLSDTLHLPDYITNNMYLIPKTGGIGLNYYHPTFLYESLWNLTGFIIMMILRKTKITRLGDLLAFYMIWYSIGRFFIEAMRTDSLYIGNTGLRAAQITSLLMIAGGLVFLILTRTVFYQKKYHVVVEELKKQNTEQLVENNL